MQNNSPEADDPKVWSIAINNKPQSGTYTKVGLRELFENETLNEGHKVWKKGMANWLKVKDVPEIAEIKTQVDLAKAPKGRWFIAKNENPKEVFTDAQIEEKLMSGAILEKTKLWRSGQTDWKPLSEISELAPIRERVAAHHAASMPPPLLDEPEGPPPLIDEPVAATTVRAKPVEVAQVAKAAPAVKLPDPVVETKAKAGLPLNDHGVASMRQIDQLAVDVKKLYPSDAKISSAVDEIKTHVKKSFLIGDPFGLDQSLGGLNNLIHVAHSKSTNGYNADMQKAGQGLVEVHAKGGKQVANVNFENQIAARFRFTFGLDTKPSWSVAPRL